MLVINNKTYYTIAEAADIAKVCERTLRRWIANGNLSHFLFPYRAANARVTYYRLEPPDETDQKWDGEETYILRRERTVNGDGKEANG